MIELLHMAPRRLQKNVNSIKCEDIDLRYQSEREKVLVGTLSRTQPPDFGDANIQFITIDTLEAVPVTCRR